MSAVSDKTDDCAWTLPRDPLFGPAWHLQKDAGLLPASPPKELCLLHPYNRTISPVVSTVKR